MKYLHLIWAGLFRKKVRTLLTLASVMAAFALFGMLDAVRVAFNATDSVAGIDRLIVISRISLIQPLPISAYNRIKALPGVADVAYANWFGGIYQDEKNFFANMAVSDQLLATNPEYRLSPEQRQAFLGTRTGAIVGKRLADRFGWKIGDKIPLNATIFPNQDGGNVWIFDLVGIFEVTEPELRGEEEQLFFRYDYFDEARLFGQGTVGWYIVKLDDPDRADELATRIDAMFANSADETKTQSEQAFQRSFVKQIGDIGLITSAIMAAVFFTLILLTGNILAQALRERISEFAVMKTLGFTGRMLLGLLLGESLLLLLLGGVAGLGILVPVIPAIDAASGGQFGLVVTPRTWVLGVVLMLGIGIIVGLAPAVRAMRLSVVDALARH